MADEELIHAIEAWVETQRNANLKGRAFAVGSPDGRRDYAVWLAEEIRAFESSTTNYELVKIIPA